VINKPELLAPAGDLERLKIALLYGADAVYCGGPAFGLRANAINFTFEELKEGVAFAHSLNKKVYVTVNIVLHNKEGKELLDYLKKIEDTKCDAIIVSDPYIVDCALKNTNLHVHLSTQQSTMNYESCKFFYEQGVERIVLARECTKEDIKSIMSHVPVEIETFIHGAMCAAISGRCVLSNFLTKRDANRGGCSQICRWDFKLLDEGNNVIETEKDFTLCSKDLSMLSVLPELIDLGIASFKIEGRMRSIYYIATVVSIYRKVIDEYCDNHENYEYNKEYEKILRRCANRDSVVQFFNGVYDESCSYYNGREEISNQDFLGVVIDYDEETHMATIEQRNYFSVGDEVEIFSPKHETIKLLINEIIDEDGNNIDVVRHPKQIIKIYIPEIVYKYDLIRKQNY
jgi:putative protease